MKKFLKGMLVLAFFVFCFGFFFTLFGDLAGYEKSSEAKKESKSSTSKSNKKQSSKKEENSSKKEQSDWQLPDDPELAEALRKIREEAEEILSEEYASFEFRGYDNRYIFTYRAERASDVGSCSVNVTVNPSLFKGYYEYDWEVSRATIAEHNSSRAYSYNIAGEWTYSDSERNYYVKIGEKYIANDYSVNYPVEYVLEGYGDDYTTVRSDGQELWGFHGDRWGSRELIELYREDEIYKESLFEIMESKNHRSHEVITICLYDTAECEAGLYTADGYKLERR